MASFAFSVADGAPVRLSHWIDGQLTEGSPVQTSPVFNPATGQISAQVLYASQADINAALVSAHTAWPGWAATSPLKRARILSQFKQLLETRAELLAQVISREHGKTISDALGEVGRGLEVVEFATGIPSLLKGDYTAQVGQGVDAWTTRQPLGVVLGVTPFNFPAMVPLWMFPVALACGNSFILKPSEKTPSAALLMAQWLTEAGLPPGVFNVVQGGQTVVENLLAHPHVKALSFVGSTPVAQALYRSAAHHGKRAQALGGAKNHLVVMPDAPLEPVVDALMGAAYGSAGERCMAISVAVAVGECANALVERLTLRIRALTIGPGNDPRVEMGPLISAGHRERVLALMDAGQREGATLCVDGRDPVELSDACRAGFFMGASLFDHVQPTMRIYQEEIFGPVLCVVRVPDMKAAIALINAHPFANGTAIFTRDGGAARYFAHHIEVGMVGINVPIPVPMAFHSFGGWKQSLFGDHHMHGPEGVRFYTRQKAVTQRWPDAVDEGAQYVMPTLK